MRKILIVDDSALRRGQIRDLLLKNKLGDCWESKGEIEAVEKFRMLKPDLVIIRISDMMGVEVVRKIININQNAKVLVLGSKGCESYVGEAVQAGAIDYIIEPVKLEGILSTIMKIIK
jgi:two-component system chemotaxis response regulator CheY